MLNSLTSNQLYEYRMRSDCNSTGSINSGWTSIANFTTLLRIEDMNSAGSAFNFKVSPNPSNGNIFIHLNSIEESRGIVNVTNLLGQVIFQIPVSVVSGENTFALDISDVSSGIFFVEVKCESGCLRQRIEILK